MAAIAGYHRVCRRSRGGAFWGLVKEAKVEIRKVVWPTRQETVQTTLGGRGSRNCYGPHFVGARFSARLGYQQPDWIGIELWRSVGMWFMPTPATKSR